MGEGVVSPKAAKHAFTAQNELIKKLALQTADIIENINVPIEALYTPIGDDYVKYNETPHFGEAFNPKL